MTSLTIPAEWLIPRKLDHEWRFRCSTNLWDLVRTNRAGEFFRQLVTFLEDDSHITDYHLKLRHNYCRNFELDVLIHFGNPHRKNQPILTPICMSCEAMHELSVVSLLTQQQHTRTWLDCRTRPKLILTPIRHVERLSELSSENGEMDAFWHDAIELLYRECSRLDANYSTMVLNHGTYRNHAHLHLKISFTNDAWESTIAPRYKEKIDQLKQLLKKPSVVEDCLGQRYLNKLKIASVREKTNDSENENLQKKGLDTQ